MREPSDAVGRSSTEPSGGTAPRLLLVVAAESEARALCGAIAVAAQTSREPGAPWDVFALGHGADLLVTGVGKANAAGAVGATLGAAGGGRGYRAVINLGIAGALPSLDKSEPDELVFPLSVGSSLVASTSTFADEGLEGPGEAFQSLAAMGFPMVDEPVISPGAAGPALGGDASLLGKLLPLVDLAAPVATVSTCSGTHAAALRVARRTGALAECMEGAAVALVCRRMRVPFAELRVISNTTGDRPLQIWKAREALARMGDLGTRVLTILGGR